MPKVLIVDDEAANLEIASALVAEDEYQVLQATDGEMAFQMVQDHRPDVVMMDVVMPKMSGIEACRKIKTNPLSYAIPVIIVTALNTTEEKIKAIRAGADDFITKPFDRVELSARLKSLLRLKSIHDRLEASLVALKEMQQVREALMIRAAKDLESPVHVITECLQMVAKEQHHLSAETSQKIEPALFCVDLVSTMTMDFMNIMRMEQDKLRKAYESLKSSDETTEES